MVLVNNAMHETTREVTVWEVGTGKEGTMVRLIETNEGGYSLEPVEYEIKSGKITITLPKTSSVVLIAKK